MFIVYDDEDIPIAVFVDEDAAWVYANEWTRWNSCEDGCAYVEKKDGE